VPEIILDGFSVDYPDFHFAPLDLAVGSGERIALLGPNGAGKSTLMRAIGGCLPGYRGSIRADDTEVRELLPGYRRNVGLLPEDLTGTPSATVGERLALIAAFHPSWDSAYERELLSALDLSVDAPVGGLSKGMKLKFSFVAAEAYRPPILLLDEPTSGLDPVVRRTFLALLDRILAEGPERTLIFSTHILEDVKAFAARVWVLHDGRMVENATVAEILSRGGGDDLSAVLYDAIDPPNGG
jgi:ABC-2 type transport system ATP-binding protein